ncbi:LOW QUALITY PROTEIN: hypothetical protein MXB_1464, partial [Myxobolus squamalis]
MFCKIRFDKITKFFDKNKDKIVFDAKILFDDRIVYKTREGFLSISPGPGIYTQSSKIICSIEDSYIDLIYRRMVNTLLDAVINLYLDHSSQIFGNKILFYMIDIETAKIVKKFRNKNMLSLPLICRTSINNDDNLLLFNSKLFCNRSQKLINSFTTFNQHHSG